MLITKVNIVKKLPVALILFFSASWLFSGCYYDVEEELYPSTGQMCDTSAVTYSLSVEPIISSNCYVCHSAAAAQGGVILDDYNSLKAYADAGTLLGVLRHESGFSPMPQGGSKLSTCTIAVIEKWVNDGSPNN